MATRNPYIFDTEIIPTLHDSEIVGAHDASIVETDISADTPYLSSLDSNFLYDRVFKGLAHDTFDTKPMDIGEYIDKYCEGEHISETDTRFDGVSDVTYTNHYEVLESGERNLLCVERDNVIEFYDKSNDVDPVRIVEFDDDGSRTERTFDDNGSEIVTRFDSDGRLIEYTDMNHEFRIEYDGDSDNIVKIFDGDVEYSIEAREDGFTLVETGPLYSDGDGAVAYEHTWELDENGEYNPDTCASEYKEFDEDGTVVKLLSTEDLIDNTDRDVINPADDEKIDTDLNDGDFGESDPYGDDPPDGSEPPDGSDQPDGENAEDSFYEGKDEW